MMQRQQKVFGMDENLKVLRVALYVAGNWSRGVTDTNNINEEIRDFMEREDVPESRFGEIRTMTDALFLFGENVRAAERKKRHIIPVFGETDLPKG